MTSGSTLALSICNSRYRKAKLPLNIVMNMCKMSRDELPFFLVSFELLFLEVREKTNRPDVFHVLGCGPCTTFGRPVTRLVGINHCRTFLKFFTHTQTNLIVTPVCVCCFFFMQKEYCQPIIKSQIIALKLRKMWRQARCNLKWN